MMPIRTSACLRALLILLSAIVLRVGATPAHAQGCGPQNPNCIVATQPAGDSSNRAASTAFVKLQGYATQAWVLAQSYVSNLLGGIQTNTINARSADYPIDATDAGKTILMTGGPFTVTLPAPAGFPSRSTVRVCNANANDATTHAVRLSGFPAPVFLRLYQKTCVEVAIENGAWAATVVPGRFRPAFQPRLYIDNGGSSINDGLLSNAAGNALQSVQQCFTIVQNEYDLIGQQPVCSPTGGQTFVGSFSITGQLVGSVVISLTGNGGTAVLRPTPGSGSILLLSDWAPGIISNNITWDCTGGATTCAGAYLHQDTVFEVNTGTIFVGAGPFNSAVVCDNRCLFNTISNFTITGRFGDVFVGNSGAIFQVFNGVYLNTSIIVDSAVFKLTASTMVYAGLLQSGGGATIGVDVVQLRMGSRACLYNLTTAGAFTAARKFSVLGNSVLSNFGSTALPGTGAGVVTATGYANGFAPDGVGGNTGVGAAGC